MSGRMTPLVTDDHTTYKKTLSAFSLSLHKKKKRLLWRKLLLVGAPVSNAQRNARNIEELGS